MLRLCTLPRRERRWRHIPASATSAILLSAATLALGTVACTPESDSSERREDEAPAVSEVRPDMSSTTDSGQATPETLTSDQQIALGARVFLENCASCHQGGGEGIEGEVPPLAGSDFLNEDKVRAIGIVAQGLDGEVVVNGHEFAERMPSPGLSDQDVSNVLTYVYSQWGNSAQVVSPAEVRAVRR